MNPLIKSLLKPLVLAFLRAELPVIEQKLREKGVSEENIQLVDVIVNKIIDTKGGV